MRKTIVIVVKFLCYTYYFIVVFYLTFTQILRGTREPPHLKKKF